MITTTLLLFIASLALGCSAISLLIATDKRRFLARYHLAQWPGSDYFRALPNFLQGMYDSYYYSPWPGHRNPLSAAVFQLRAGRLLRNRQPASRKTFLRQHVALFALIEKLRPFLVDFMLNEQQRIVSGRISEMEDSQNRDRLIAYVDSIRRHRTRFFASLTIADRQTLAQIIDRRIVPVLRSTHAIFQEHGFELLPEFTQLRRWSEMDGGELVQELGTLPTSRHRDLPSQLPAH